MKKKKNKKGFELSITAIVLIILGLLVLVVLIYGFTFGWNVFWNKIIGYSGGKDNVQAVISSCELACSGNNKYDYCELKRKIIENSEEKEVTCSNLEDTRLNCPNIFC